MFRVSFLVKDKNLAEVLTMLAGKIGTPEVVPVPSDKKDNQPVEVASVGEIMASYIATLSRPFKTNEIVQAVRVNRPETAKTSVYSALNKLVKSGILDKKDRGTFAKREEA